MKNTQNPKTVLQILKDADIRLSGEKIAQELNISRAAVWKRIEKLREEGFKIDAQPRSGYSLTSSPDALIPEEIESGLDQESMFAGNIIYYKTIDSTNLIAKKMAVDGAVLPLKFFSQALLKDSLRHFEYRLIETDQN